MEECGVDGEFSIFRRCCFFRFRKLAAGAHGLFGVILIHDRPYFSPKKQRPRKTTHIIERNLYTSKVYLVPSDDPHLSEYVPAAYMRRGYVTDFHGSAGTALVTSAGKAILWTDSRYFNEAGLSLDGDHWELMRQGEKNVPTVVKFLSDAAIEHRRARGAPLRVGMDAYVHSASFARELADAFADGGVNGGGSTDPAPPAVAVIDTLDGVPNIVDSIWEGRPALPKNPFRVHVSFADQLSGGTGVASWDAIYRFPHL